MKLRQNSKRFFKICIIVTVLIFFLLFYTHNSLTYKSKQIVDTCKHMVEPYCYTSAIIQYQKKHSFRKAYTLLHLIQKLDNSMAYCHFTAHKMSELEVSKNPDKWIEFLKEIDIRYCADGFLHGATETYIKYNPHFILNGKSTLALCNQLGTTIEDGKDLVWTAKEVCLHTMGHLILLQNKGDVNRSVEICNSLQNDSYKAKCNTGIFMEYITMTGLEDHGYRKALVWNDGEFQKMENMCNGFNVDLSGITCWAQLAKEYIIHRSNGDPNKLFVYCQKASNQPSKNACYTNGAVFIGIKTGIGIYPRKYITILCQPYRQKKNEYAQCIQIIIRYVGAGLNSNQEELISLCNNVDLDYQQLCFQQLHDIMRERLNKKMSLQICMEFPEAYQNQCYK